MEINWVQIGIGAATGGFAGAFIKQFFDNRKNRIQPIGNLVEINSLYVSFENKLVDSEVILKDESGEFKFSRLFTGTLKIINAGSIDFTEFSFGLTLPEDARFIQVKANTIDRHHNADIDNKPTLTNQINAFDMKLKPFNRRDEYNFDFLVMSNSSNIETKDLVVSSPHPIKWVGSNTTSGMIIEIAKNTILKIGPLSIGFERTQY